LVTPAADTGAMRLCGWAAGLLIVVVLAVGCSADEAFEGTLLDPVDDAPAIRLSDQFGESVALSDFAGKVVLLTFLYTSCPDVCPIVTETLRRTHELLGSDAARVQMVAVSVDPEGDSVGRAHQYSEEREMQDKWRFLVGTEEELEPIWRSYWLDPVSTNRGGSGHDGGSVAEEAGAPVSVGGYLIAHGAPVFLIDSQGKRRVLFTNLSLEPRPLVHDIRLLLR
jgi:protein SCO1/2